jgi:hypothetical protein
VQHSPKDPSLPRSQSIQWDIPPLVAFIALAAILVYAFAFLSPALKLGFTTDDFDNLQAPPWRTSTDIPAVMDYAVSRTPRIFTQGIYYSIAKTVWGLNPRPWHASNLIFFGTDVVLLFAMLFGLFRVRLTALIGTGIYALTGALFFAPVWVTGIEELLATLFCFSAFLSHISARDSSSTWKKISFEFLAFILLGLALISKQTTIPLVALFILYDLITSRRLSVTSIAAIALAALVFWLGLQRLTQIENNLPQYNVSMNPKHLLVNLALYFYEPIIATGGDYWLLNHIGVTGSKEEALANVLAVAVQNKLPAIIIGIAAIVLAAFVLWFTLKPSPDKHAQIGPLFGWVAWLLMLSPVVIIPGHHYPYYLTMPFGFLMIAIVPAIANCLREKRWRVPVSIGLLLYICWFPLNTALAFQLSSITQGAAYTKMVLDGMRAIRPVITPGTIVAIDDADYEKRIALDVGRSFELQYPGTKGMTFGSIRESFAGLQLPKPPKFGPIVVFRVENGVVRDVTSEFQWLNEINPGSNPG